MACPQQIPNAEYPSASRLDTPQHRARTPK